MTNCCSNITSQQNRGFYYLLLMYTFICEGHSGTTSQEVFKYSISSFGAFGFITVTDY